MFVKLFLVVFWGRTVLFLRENNSADSHKVTVGEMK